MATRSEALRGNQNASGPRGVKGIAAKVTDAASALKSKATSALAGPLAAAKTGFNSVKVKTASAANGAKVKVVAAGSAAGAAGAAKIKSGIGSVKNAMPAARKDRVRVDANRSAFIRSERNAGNAAAKEAGTVKGKVKAAVSEAKYQVSKAGRQASKTGSTIGGAFKDTYGGAAKKAKDGVVSAAKSITGYKRSGAGK